LSGCQFDDTFQKVEVLVWGAIPLRQRCFNSAWDVAVDARGQCEAKDGRSSLVIVMNNVTESSQSIERGGPILSVERKAGGTKPPFKRDGVGTTKCGVARRVEKLVDFSHGLSVSRPSIRAECRAKRASQPSDYCTRQRPAPQTRPAQQSAPVVHDCS